jgi:hypothetical protein
MPRSGHSDNFTHPETKQAERTFMSLGFFYCP